MIPHLYKKISLERVNVLSLDASSIEMGIGALSLMMTVIFGHKNIRAKKVHKQP